MMTYVPHPTLSSAPITTSVELATVIKIESTSIGGVACQTVNARDLHAFLESKQQFADWIKVRIDQYGFAEGQDFTVHKFMNRRASQTDYYLIIDMAKELAMVERNDKGKQARQYFIECERRARVSPAVLSNGEMFLQSAQLLLALEVGARKMEQAQFALSARLDIVAENCALSSCPANAEPITHIRKRIRKKYGIPIHIIDEAMRQLPYAPKPAGMVVNSHEAAQGSHYAVFWTKDVTALFKRFVSECQRETTCFVTHPFIEYSFRLGVGLEDT